jgi:hypothetical protein
MQTAIRNTSLLALLIALVHLGAESLDAQDGSSVLSLLEAKGSLSIGGQVEGTLSSSDYRSPTDQYMEGWTIEGEPGQSVTIDLVSDDFDAFLYVVGPGLGETLWDDDGGGACHARVSFTFLESGEFRVVASSNGSRATGVYVLSVSSEPGPIAGYECGGINPEHLAALPVGDRELPGGERVMDSRYAEAWALEGRAGESVTITLESTAFDAYLFVIGPGLGEVLSDDDSAGELNSMITVKFAEDGMYTVVATSVVDMATGTYTIRVTQPLDLNELPTGERVAEIGGTMDGYLTATDPVIGEGRHGQAWSLSGSAGQTIIVDLISTEFDAYLMLVGPGIDEPIVDDDGGDDLNSRLSVALPEDGEYRVIVTSASGGETGRFTLRVGIR